MTLPQLFTTQFVGAITVDGQTAKVSAIAVDQEEVIVLSLVGSDVTTGAIASTIYSGKESVIFTPAPGIALPSLSLKRHSSSMQQFVAEVPDMVEKQLVMLCHMGNISHLLSSRNQYETIYLLAQDDEMPSPDVIAGHLDVLGIPYLDAWIPSLWRYALASPDLLTRLPGAGVTAYRLSGDVAAWSALYQTHLPELRFIS